MYDVVSVEIKKKDDTFDLRTNFPLHVYTQKQMTLEEAGLVSQVVLFAREI